MPGLVSLQLMRRFGLPASVLGMVSSIQFLMYMVLQVPVGILGDRYGPETFLVLGGLLDGAGTLMFALAGSTGWLFVGRAMVGLGDAMIWINLVLLFSYWFAPREFLATLGLASMAGNAGTVLTMLPVSLWLAHTDWRVPFIVVGLGLLSAGGLMAVVFRRASAGAAGRRRAGRKPARGGFRSTLQEVLGERRIWPLFWAHFSIVGIYTGFTAAWIIPYLMITCRVTRVVAGTLVTVTLAGSLVGGPAAGAAGRYLAEERLYFGLNLLFVLSWLALYCTGGLLLYPALFLLGLAAGGAIVVFALVRRFFGLEAGGLASGVVNTGGFLGAVCLPVLFGLVLERFSPGHGAYTPYAFHLAVGVCGLLSLTGLAASGLLLAGTRPDRVSPGR